MLNVELSDQEISDITAFLGILTGTMPETLHKFQSCLSAVVKVTMDLN